MRLLSLFGWLMLISCVCAVLSAQRPAVDAGSVAKASTKVRTDRYGDPLPENALARIGSPRLRHSNRITSVVFSGDGKSLFTSGTASQGFEGIACWETATGKLQRRIPCQGYGAHCLALSPDGKTLAAVSDGRDDIWLIDVASGKTLRQFGEKLAEVTHIAAAFSPDGTTLASCGAGGVLLWNVKTGTLRRRFRNWGADSGLAYSPDGKLLAGISVALAGTGDASGLLGDLTSGKERWRVSLGKAYAACSLAFAPDGAAVAFGDANGQVRMMEPASGKESRRIPGHKGLVWALAFTPDGKHLASGGEDCTVRIWDLAVAKEKYRFQVGWRASVLALAFAPDGRTLAGSCNDQTVRLWSIAEGKELLPISGHRDFVTALAFAPDGHILASADFGGRLLLSDSAGLKPMPTLARHAEPINAVVFAPDGKSVVSGCWGGKVILWDAATGKERFSFKGHRDRVYALAFAPDGKILASASIDSTIRLWHPATGKQIGQMEGGAVWKWVTSLAFSVDGRLLASAREDGSIRVCEVATGKEIRKLEGHKGHVTSIASSPDGRHLVSGGEDHTVRVWEWASGKEVRHLKGCEDMVRSVDFAPDGRTVVAGGEDMTVQLWEVASGQRIARFPGHQEIVYSVAFAPDGRSVASGSRDSTILFWDVTRQAGAPPTQLSAKAGIEAWARLAASDAVLAHQALWRMVRSPAESVPLLREMLRPAEPVTKQHIARRVADLEANGFATRERATRELEQLAELAIPALRAALAGQPNLELRLRAERLLQRILTPVPPLSRLRLGRALFVLEQIGTPQAREVLDSLAKGAEGAWLTHEARAALRRLEARQRRLAAGKLDHRSRHQE